MKEIRELRRRIGGVLRMLTDVQGNLLDVLMACEEARGDVMELRCPADRCRRCPEKDVCVFWNVLEGNLRDEDKQKIFGASQVLHTARSRLLTVLDGVNRLKSVLLKSGSEET